MKIKSGMLIPGHSVGEAKEQAQSPADQEKQIARLHTLQEIGQKLNSNLDLEDALVNILDQAIQAVGAERGCLLLVDEATDQLEVRLCRHLRPSEFNGKPFHFSRTVIERVWREGTPLLTANALEDPELTKADSVINYTLRSILCVPLHSQGRRIGILYLDNRLKVGQFQEDDLTLAIAIADHAAIALRNAQLHQEAVERARKQMEVLQHIQSLNQLSLKVQGLTNFPDLLAVIGQELGQFGYHCAVALLTHDRTSLEVQYLSSVEAMGSGVPDCRQGSPCVSLDETNICRQVLETRTGQFTSDLDTVLAELLGQPSSLAAQPAFVAPLVASNQAIGLLILGLANTRLEDSTLLMAFTNQIATIIETFRLYAGAQRRLEEQAALREASAALSSTLDLGEILAEITERAARIVGADSCAISRWDQENDALVVLTDYISPEVTIPDNDCCDAGFAYPLPDYPATARVLQDHIPLIVYADDPTADETEKALLKTFQWDGVLMVPMLDKGQAVGLMELYIDDRQRSQFTGEDVVLCQTMANQGAIAIKKADLHAELQQQLAEMQSVLAITRAMVSEVSLDKLLEFIMAQAEHLIDAQGAAVLLTCPDGQSLEAAPASASWLGMQAGLSFSALGSLVGLAIDRQQVQVSNQAWDDDRVLPVQTWLQAIELRSLLCAPLVVQGKSLGVLLVWNKQDGAFTPHDTRLMGLFADQAALALHNAQLYQAAHQELAERRRAEEALLRHYRELELLNQASQAFNSTLHLNQVLATVLEGIRHLLSVTACSIWLIDPETDELVCRQATGPGSESVRGRHLALGEGLAGEVASRGESQVVPDTWVDERFYAGAAQRVEGEARSVLCVPLRPKRGVIGVIYLADTRIERFSSSDLRWVEALAAAAASAIENAQLHTRIRRLAAEKERQRLARELHDTVTQSLYSIGMAAQTSLKLLREVDLDSKALDAIEHILSLSQMTLCEMRERIYDLHPTALADRGLVEAMAQHCEMLRTYYLLSIEFEADLEQLLSMTEQETLYYIARESLWNAIKYAGATRIGVSLKAEHKQATLCVVDDGSGFDPSIFVREETVGLRNMKQRAELLGGTFALESKPGHGTRITAQIPIRSSSDAASRAR